jgi:tetratricopeptide (TPR) repeat protein
MKDLFSVQDNISKEVVTALRVKIVEGEQAQVWGKSTSNLEAYIKFLQAYDTFKSFNKKNMILTRQICEEAIALDPKYDAPYSLLGCTHMMDLWFQWWEESPHASMEKAEEALRKAVALNPLSDYAWANLGHLYLMQKRHNEAIAAGEKSVGLNPNGDYNMVILAMTYMFCRRAEEAIRMYEEAWRLNPYCPAYYLHAAGVAYFELRKWDEAIDILERALERYPDNFAALMNLAAAYGQAGRLEEGQAVAEQILKFNPGYCVENQWLVHKFESDSETWREGWRRVGIPEKCPPK